MPQEEKTTASLTQTLGPFFAARAALPRVCGVTPQVSCSGFFSHRNSCSWLAVSVSGIATSNQLARWQLHVGHQYAHGLHVKCHCLLKIAPLRLFSLTEQLAIHMLIVKKKKIRFWRF